MKALLLTEYWPPQVGGVQNYLTQVAGNLSAGSVDVVAPLLPKGVSEGTYGPGVGSIFRTRWFWPVVKPSWFFLWRTLTRITAATHYDVTLCGKGLVEGLLGYYLKKKRGTPYVVFTYAMEINAWTATARNKRKLIKVLTNADRVVYINEVTKKELLHLGVQEKQLVKIWPGIDERFFADSTDSEVLKKYNIQPPYILAVGRLIPRKGFDTLIEAFSEIEQTRFANVQLVIVGDGPEKESLQHVASDSFVQKSVVFLSDVPDADLPALYRGAHVFALTPRPVAGDIEGFGMVYIEAAAAAVPAIATVTGGVPEAVLHKETGIVVQPDSPSAVAEALSLLLSDTALRETLGRQAQKRAADQFRWKKRVLLVKGMIDAIIAEQVLRS
jgi:phosphatidylinositol alpha-1,6-mannosyltransferase